MKAVTCFFKMFPYRSRSSHYLSHKCYSLSSGASRILCRTVSIRDALIYIFISSESPSQGKQKELRDLESVLGFLSPPISTVGKKKLPTMASRSPVSNHFHVSDLTNYLNSVLRTWINRFPLSRACFDFNLCCRLVWNPWSVVSGELQTSLLLLLLQLVLKWSLPLLQHLNCLRSLKQGMMRFWWLNWRVINYLDLWFFWLNYEVFLLFVCFD